MKKTLFVYNPRSGQGHIANHLAKIIQIAVENGYEVTAHPTQHPKDATEKTSEEAKLYDLLLVAGGDGTLDEAVTGMMRSEKKVPIGYIPAGSTNDFGNSLGIDKDMEKAANIAFSGEKFDIDVGSFNNDYFVYVAAFGVFTEVSYQTPQESKNLLGHAAYVLEGIKSLADVPSYKMQVEHDGKVFYDEFIYGMVTNSNTVGGFRGLIPNDISLNDGMFEVTLIKFPKNPIEFSDILAYLSGVAKDSQMVYSFTTKEIKFTAKTEIPWTLDGEDGGKHRVSLVKNNNKALTIMVDGAQE